MLASEHTALSYSPYPHYPLSPTFLPSTIVSRIDHPLTLLPLTARLSVGSLVDTLPCLEIAIYGSLPCPCRTLLGQSERRSVEAVESLYCTRVPCARFLECETIDLEPPRRYADTSICRYHYSSISRLIIELCQSVGDYVNLPGAYA